MKQLIPPKISPSQEEKIVRALQEFVEDNIFKDIFDFFEGYAKIENAKLSELEKALRRGDITFDNGEFYGKYNSKISKELRSIGAIKSGPTFKLLKSKIPDNISKSIEIGVAKYERDIEKVDKLLKDSIEKIELKQPKIKSIVSDTFFQYDSETTEKLKEIGITAELNAHQFENIIEMYIQNYQRDIKNFALQEISDMRLKIHEMQVSGQRSKALLSYLTERRSVSKSRALFIARQETQLAASAYHTEKFKSAGSSRYRWRCVSGSKNHPVREDHKRLNNQVFEWDNPPITNLNTGARNNPGEDFRCRCTAIPLFD